MVGVAWACGAVTVTPVGEFPMPGLQPGKDAPPGLSGLTRVGGDTYFTVCDKGGWLHQLTICMDRASGAITGCVFGLSVKLEGKGKLDFESVAWDDANRWVWIGDELDGSIRAFHPTTGKRVKEVDVPAVYDAFRYNRSFESLSIRAGGLEMWTCNEDALCRSDAVNKIGPPVDDGPRTTREHGSTVRVQKLARATPQATSADSNKNARIRFLLFMASSFLQATLPLLYPNFPRSVQWSRPLFARGEKPE